MFSDTTSKTFSGVIVSTSAYAIFLPYLPFTRSCRLLSFIAYPPFTQISFQNYNFSQECLFSLLLQCPHDIQCVYCISYICTPYQLSICRHKYRIFFRTSGSILFLGYIRSCYLFSARKKHRPFERCSLRT